MKRLASSPPPLPSLPFPSPTSAPNTPPAMPASTAASATRAAATARKPPWTSPISPGRSATVPKSAPIPWSPTSSRTPPAASPAVVYRDLSDPAHPLTRAQRTRNVFLCAGGIETPRLLLMTASPTAPARSVGTSWATSPPGLGHVRRSGPHEPRLPRDPSSPKTPSAPKTPNSQAAIWSNLSA